MDIGRITIPEHPEQKVGKTPTSPIRPACWHTTTISSM
jgi:hypothetical protein